MSDGPVIIFPMPSLVSLLLRAEREKGSPLTQAEVLAIRDGCACVALPPDVVASVARKRGYQDIDLDRCWEQWQEVRKDLLNESAPSAAPETNDQ